MNEKGRGYNKSFWKIQAFLAVLLIFMVLLLGIDRVWAGQTMTETNAEELLISMDSDVGKHIF